MGFKAMNKKGLQLKRFFFAIIVVSVVIISIGVIVGEWDTKYNSGLNYDLSDFDNLDVVSTEAKAQKDRISPEGDDPGTGDFEGLLFSGGYGVLGRIFTPFKAVNNMLETVENRFGLPGFVGEALLTMMIIALVTSIIAVLFRLPRGSA